MTKRLFAVVSIVALAGIIVAGQQSASQAKIQGVWRLVERTTTGPGAYTTKTPQPVMWVFTPKYFSQIRIDSNKPLADLADAAKATADELRAAWGPFTASAGTYELSDGNIVTFRVEVGKSNAQMGPGNFYTWSYKLEGNTLSLTNVGGMNGPVAFPGTMKFTRVE